MARSQINTCTWVKVVVDVGVNACVMIMRMHVMTMQMPTVDERYVHVIACTDYEEWMIMFQ